MKTKLLALWLILVSLVVLSNSVLIADATGAVHLPAPVGISTNTPAASLHVKGDSNWGVIVQNHEPVWHESSFMIREPLSDVGNRFSVVVGSGTTSGVEIHAGRDETGTPVNLDIDTGAWRWKYGSGAVYMKFDQNGVACFGPNADCSNGKSVEIRAKAASEDSLKIIGVSNQTGGLLKILSAGGATLLGVYQDGTTTPGLYTDRDIWKNGQSTGIFAQMAALEARVTALEQP